MPDIALPRGIKGIKEFPRLKEYLINLIPTKNGAIRTPGITSFANGEGDSRGGATWSVTQKSYFVSGTRFIRVNIDGTTTNIGEIIGSAPVFFSKGQVNLVIGVVGGNAYRYNETEGLLEINDPDFKPSVSADFIDGRHVFVPADGSPPFYTEVDSAGSIEPLAFFDAEELPDLNKAVINVSNQLYVIGEDSSEVFRTNVDPDVVFSRREGARIDVGYIAGLTRYKTSFAFLGRLREEGPRIYVMGSGTAAPISNDSVDELLADMDESERVGCIGSRFEWKGMEILIFSFTTKTLAFHEGEWFYLDSTIDGVVSPWRVRGISRAYGKYLVGDKGSSSIGYLSESGQEFGNNIEWSFRTFIRSNRNTHFSVGTLELDGLAGKSNDERTIGLAVSKDGQTFGDFHYRSLGTRGQYEKRIKWQPPGGLGHYENYCGIEIRSNSDASFGMEALTFS